MIWYKITEHNGSHEYTHTYTMQGDIDDYDAYEGDITDEDILKHFYGEHAIEYNEKHTWWLQGECLVEVQGVVEYDDDAQALHRILNKKLNGLL